MGSNCVAESSVFSCSLERKHAFRYQAATYRRLIGFCDGVVLMDCGSVGSSSAATLVKSVCGDI